MMKNKPLINWICCFVLALALVSASACSAGEAIPPAGDEPGVTQAAGSVSPLSPLPQVTPPQFPLTGLETYSITPESGLDQLTQSGAYWVRRNLVIWSEVEPEPGLRQWEKLAGLEQELVYAAQRHFQVILVVRGTPAWAQQVPGSLCGPVLPEKLPAFAAFLHDLVARYSQPPFQVRYWEMGNEPDVDPTLVAPDSNFGCWGRTGAPYYGGADYAAMLEQAYPQIKAADPQAQVILGGLLLDCDPDHPPAGRSCEPSSYLEGILKAGGGDYFDGISFHAYDYYLGPDKFANPNWNSTSTTTGPALVVKARFLRRILQTYAVSDKYLLNTEAGLICGRTGAEPECQDEAFQLTKASYVALSHAAAAAEGLRANVWHSLLGWRSSGLVTGDLQPLPAHRAFHFSSKMLNGAAFIRAIEDYPAVKGYEFVLDGQRFWLLWSLDGSQHSVELPALPAAVFDVTGAPVPPAQSLIISPAPLYILY